MNPTSTAHDQTPDARFGPIRTFKETLFEAILDSQDGKPRATLWDELEQGRLISVSDNLNRLLADAINNAVDQSGTPGVEQLASDLEYAAAQIKAAYNAIREIYPEMF